jgi:hypothetical protein
MLVDPLEKRRWGSEEFDILQGASDARPEAAEFPPGWAKPGRQVAGQMADGIKG